MSNFFKLILFALFLANISFADDTLKDISASTDQVQISQEEIDDPLVDTFKLIKERAKGVNPLNDDAETKKENLKNLKKIKKALAANSALTEDQVEQVGINVFKLLLNGAYNSDQNKIAQFKLTEKYIKKIIYITYYQEDLLNKIISEVPSWTLKDEADFIINSVRNIEIPKELEKQVNEYVQESLPLLKAASLVHFGQRKEHANLIVNVLEQISNGKTDDKSILKIYTEFQKISDKLVNQIKNVGEFLAKSDQITFPNKDLQKFVKLFLNFYYQNVHIDVIKNIISDTISLRREPSKEEMVKIMFLNSGPGLGKTLQQLGKEPGLGDSIAKLMVILESKGKAVPFHLVEEFVNEQNGYKFTSIDQKALGTGTVAQVHKATLEVNGKEIETVIRFIKPGLDQRAEDDIRILTKFVDEMIESGVIKIPGIKNLVSGIGDFLRLDLDLKGTMLRQLDALKLYQNSFYERVGFKFRKISILVPKLFLPNGGNEIEDNPKIHVQQLLSGDKFEKVVHNNKTDARFVAQGMTRHWFEQVIFESGIMHGDLHQGNFAIDIVEKNGKIDIVIYDYGMVETVKKDIRRAFVRLAGATSGRDAEILAESLSSLVKSDENKSKLYNDIFKIVDASLEEIPVSKKIPMDHWIKLMIKEGYQIPDQLVTLARGAKLVKQLGSIIGYEKLSGRIARKLAFKETIEALVERDGNYPLMAKDVIQLGYSNLKSGCVKAFDKFMGIFK